MRAWDDATRMIRFLYFFIFCQNFEKVEKISSNGKIFHQRKILDELEKFSRGLWKNLEMQEIFGNLVYYGNAGKFWEIGIFWKYGKIW